jgi:hypothetical protein
LGPAEPAGAGSLADGGLDERSYLRDAGRKVGADAAVGLTTTALGVNRPRRAVGAKTPLLFTKANA